MSAYRKWTAAEDELLRKKAYLGKMGLTKLLDRSPDAIEHHARNIGVSLVTSATAKARWSSADYEILQANAHLGAKVLVRLLRRPFGSIYSVASDMGIKIGTETAWTEQQIAKLTEMSSGHTARQIGDAIGRTVDSVYKKSRQLGLRLRHGNAYRATGYAIKRAPTELDLAEAVRLYKTGMTPSAVMHAMPMGQRSQSVTHALQAMIEDGRLQPHPKPVRVRPVYKPHPCKGPGCRRFTRKADGFCELHRRLESAGTCPYTPDQLQALYTKHATIAMVASAKGYDPEVMGYWMREAGVRLVPGRTSTKEEREEKEKADRQALLAIRAEEARQEALAAARRRLQLRQMPACEIEAMQRLHAERVRRALGVAA